MPPHCDCTTTTVAVLPKDGKLAQGRFAMELPCSQRSDLSAEGKHSEHPSLLFRCNHQEKDLHTVYL